MQKEKSVEAIKPKRSIFLTFLCLISFTYSALFALLFLTGMFYSIGKSGILSQYLDLYDLNRLNFFLFSIGGFLIFFAAFIGVFLMWKLQWLGYYIYVLASFIFIIAEIVISGVYLVDIIIHAVFIFFFAVALGIIKLRKKKAVKSELANLSE